MKSLLVNLISYLICRVCSRTYVTFIFVILIYSSFLSGQSRSVHVSGVVKEAVSGEAIINANVLIYVDSLRSQLFMRGTATNKSGFYSIPDVVPGTYYLFASSVGFETLMRKVDVNSNQSTVRIDFNLVKTSYEIDAVVVEGRKPTDFTVSVSTIELDPELVQKLPSFGGETDIFRALQLLPGVTTATEISTGIYVRGGSPDQNLTLVDGVVVYNPSHLGGFSSTFNSDVIKNIKLIKSGFPAQYGGRLSSVLDLSMREGTKEKFKGSASINNLSSRATIEGPLEENVTYILSARMMYLDRILPLIKRFDKIPRYSFFDFNGKINYDISEKNKLFISGFYSTDQINEPPANEDVGFDISWKNATANLSWTNFTSSTVFSNTSLMYTNYEFITLLKDKLPGERPLDFFTSSVIHDISFKRDMEFFVSSDHVIKAGADLIYHDFSTTTSDYFIPELRYRPVYGTDISAFEAAIYIQDEWNISEKIRTNIGARLYYFPNGKLVTVEPRFSATYFVLDRFVLRGAFAVANQTLHMLTRSDIYLPADVWYPSTDKITPARSYQATVGLEVTSASGSFLLSVEGYYKEMNNIYEYRENADFSYGTPFHEQITAGKGEAYGVEIFLNKRIGAITGWVGYTLAWTKKFFNDLNRGRSFYPRYDRRHDISLVANYQFNQEVNFSATWTYGTGQAVFLPIGQYSFRNLSLPGSNTAEIFIENSPRDAFRLPEFHKLDLSLSYKMRWVSESLETTLSVYNVYNRFNIFSKYIGYRIDETTGEKIPVLKQFTLFPFLPSFGIKFEF